MANKNTEDLLKELALASKLVQSPLQEEVVKTTKAASTLAIVYESARNAVEFRADHLLRQGAIMRILKRRLLLNQDSKKLSRLLIKELLWGRYLKENSVSLKEIKKITTVIEKYRFVLKGVGKEDKKGGKNSFLEWLLGLASCEIEDNLVFDPIPQIIINYVSASLFPRLDFNESDLEIKSTQVYIATERGFAQNSEIFIAYRLLKTIYPEWFRQEIIDENVVSLLRKAYLKINAHLNHPLRENLRRQVIKMAPPFNLIRELIDEYPQEIEEMMKDKEELEDVATSLLHERYSETRDKLARASFRSIVYIFLTKMVLGLLLELPFDLFLGNPNFLALGVNSLFPPFLMFLLNMGVKLPDEENTERVISKVDEYIYGKESGQPTQIKVKEGNKNIDQVFWVIYLFTFVFIFGGIVYLLDLLHFNIVSQIIFLFFLSVISFFAFRVRGIAKDYLLEEEGKESFLSSLMDFLFLPIIKVGQWLSIQISNINILSFILDFIIEAPLKTFLEVVEEWIHFVRIKKEEIVG